MLAAPTTRGRRVWASTSSGEAAMGEAIWMVATRCTDPAREDDFNRWYDEVHLPDILSVPHVVAARRYRLARDASRSASPWAAEDGPRYLAVYELDTADPDAVLRAVGELRPRLVAEGRMIDVIEGSSSTFFTALGARQEATAAQAVG